MAYIEAQNLTKYYAGLKALEKVSFRVEKGDIYCLLGANGAGKSTIIKLLLGLANMDKKDSGKFFFKDKRMNLDSHGLFGYVPEERVLIEDLTGSEYVDLIAKFYKYDLHQNAKKYYFRLFGMLEKSNFLIKNYSNGMKKKILLISALIHSPEVLIIDEPFAALDPESIFILKRVLLRLSDKGCTIILSSHNLKIIEDICSRIMILKQGKMLFEGSKEHLFAHYKVTTLEDSYIKLTRGRGEVREIENTIINIPYAN